MENYTVMAIRELSHGDPLTRGWLNDAAMGAVREIQATEPLMISRIADSVSLSVRPNSNAVEIGIFVLDYLNPRNCVHDEFIFCWPWTGMEIHLDYTVDKEQRTKIAKPFSLRRYNMDSQTINGFSYEFSTWSANVHGGQSRKSTEVDTGISESQVITPAYNPITTQASVETPGGGGGDRGPGGSDGTYDTFVNPESLILAAKLPWAGTYDFPEWPKEEREKLQWIDLNIAGRQWKQKDEEDE
jgi:hypothetical protein